MTINGMTSSASALRYWERRQEVSANNLANVSTDGFKAERVFASLLNGSEPVIGTSTDHRNGTLRQTGSPMDVALGGKGFLVVETAGGERFTRGGSLQLDREGFLADLEGNRILGSTGRIHVGSASLSISPRGDVSLDGAKVSQLRIEGVAEGVRLAHEGGTRFVPDASRTDIAAGERDVRQGSVEESNSDPLGGLVDMIGVQRAYAAVQKSISVLDHIQETATTQLGKPV
jgi:flagellar basal-body rod protein FlgF